MKRHPRGRTFEEITEKHGAHWRRVAVIRCRHCGAHENLNLKMGVSLLPPAAIEKKFTQKGWVVGSNENWDTCPDCVSKFSKPALKIVPKEEVTPMKPEPKLVVAEPRAMQRDDRRIIFEKLNGVYLDEKRGYDADWSDHRVATDLGVPRVWVEQVREEMFGPIATNPAIEDFMKGVQELCAYSERIKAVEDVRKQVEEIRTMIGGLNLASMLDRLNKLEKLSVEVKKHIP